MKRILASTTLKSALNQQSVLKPKGNLFKKTIVGTLILTSLVDVFSILVIYLLVNTSASQEVPLNGKIELPIASQTESIDSGLIVRLEGNKIYIDDQPASQKELASRLGSITFEEGKEKSLVIQADRQMNYSELSPILLSAAKSGFTKVRFAVIQGG